MTDAIGPGDWVECISVGPPSISPLRKGAIYQVDGFVEWEGRVGVVLVSPPPPPLFVGFDTQLFRPIYRPKADLFDRLLEPVLEEVPA